MAEVSAFVRSAVGSGAVLLALRFLLPDSLADLRIPVSIVVMTTLIAFGGLLGIRVGRRALWEQGMSRRRSVGGKAGRSPVLLVGAGAAGVMAVREIRSRGEQGMDLRGFVDDDPAKQGAVISGLRVLGTTEQLPKLVGALGIEQVIITIADAPQAQLRRILSICERIPVKAQMIPAMYDLLQGKVSISSLREVRVEDLLHRDEVSLEEHDLQGFLAGRV